MNRRFPVWRQMRRDRTRRTPQAEARPAELLQELRARGVEVTAGRRTGRLITLWRKLCSI